MKKKALVFLIVVLLVLSIVPVVNLTRLISAENNKKIRWKRTVLYNFDFALPYIRSFFYPFGISTNPNQVMIGKDGWLYLGDRLRKKQDNQTLTFLRHGPTSNDVEIARTIGDATKSWQQWLRNEGVRLYQIILSPDKETIYPEYLPDWTHPVAKTVTDVIMEGVDKDIYIDTRAALKKAKSQYSEPLYYKTDTHWNNLGAWVAFREFTKNLERHENGLRFIADHQIRVAAVKDRAAGDLAGFLWMSTMLSDREVYLDLEKSIQTLIQEYDYESGRLLFAGYNFEVSPPVTPLLVKSLNALNQKKVLWLRDSFGTAMSPYMAVTFSETLQMRYDRTSPDMFARLVKAFKPDYVFVTVVERDSRFEWFTNLPPQQDHVSALATK